MGLHRVCNCFIQFDSCNCVELEGCAILQNNVKWIYCIARHTYLFCGSVSKGAAVVREAPAEEAAQQRRQEETVSLQDDNLFFQTQYLTYWASRQLCRKVYSVRKWRSISKKLWMKVRGCFF